MIMHHFKQNLKVNLNILLIDLIYEKELFLTNKHIKPLINVLSIIESLSFNLNKFSNLPKHSHLKHIEYIGTKIIEKKC